MFKKRQVRQQSTRLIREEQSDGKEESASVVSISSISDVKDATSTETVSDGANSRPQLPPPSQLPPLTASVHRPRLALFGDEGDMTVVAGKKKKRKDKFLVRPNRLSGDVSVFGGAGGAFGAVEDLDGSSPAPPTPAPPTPDPPTDTTEKPSSDCLSSDVEVDETEEIQLDSSLMELVRQRRENLRSSGIGIKRGSFAAVVSTTKKPAAALRERVARVSARAGAEVYDISGDEDDEWEMQQAMKGVGSAGLAEAARKTPSPMADADLMKKHSPTMRWAGAIELTDTERVLRGNAIPYNPADAQRELPESSISRPPPQSSTSQPPPHPMMEADNPFDLTNELMTQLSNHLESLNLSKTQTASKKEKKTSEKIEAANEMKTSEESTDEFSLLFFREIAEFVDDLSDLIEEKSSSVDIATHAMIEMEEQMAEKRYKNRLYAFHSALRDCGEDIPFPDSTPDEFGRSQELRVAQVMSEIQTIWGVRMAEKEKEEEVRWRGSGADVVGGMWIDSLEPVTSTPDPTPHPTPDPNLFKPVLYYVGRELCVLGKKGWMPDELISEEIEFQRERENFSSAAVNLFADVSDVFSSVPAVLGKVRQVLQRYPDEFRRGFWNLGIRDVIALLVQFDLLMLDPFVSNHYWDIATSTPAPYKHFEELRWYGPVVDFVLDAEEAGENAADNLMSFLVFKKVVPRVISWIENCWDCLSAKESKRLVSLLTELTAFREDIYSSDLQKLMHSVVEKIRKFVAEFITLPRASTSPSFHELFDLVMWRAARLSQNIALFANLLDSSVVQQLLWNDIIMKRLSFSLSLPSPSTLTALVVISSSAPAPSLDTPLPGALALGLATHLRAITIPPALQQAVQKLQL